MSTLTYRQRLDLTDASGRLRCPGCGRWRREADFAAQQTTLDLVGGGTCTMMPLCRECLAPQEETP